MNWFVISLGAALVLALTAAAVGPYFVDWNAYRDAIETHAESLLGMPVRVDGQADLRLLPRPRIRLSDVSVGPAGQPFGEAERVTIEVELTPLLRRKVRVRKVRLVRPALALRVARDGTLVLPARTGTPGAAPARWRREDVAVEALAAEDLHIRLEDARTGARHTIVASLTASARSLAGPFTAEGTVRFAGREHSVRLAGGTREADGRMALSARLATAGADTAAAFEGTFLPSGRSPSLEGRLTVTGEAPMPWSLRGTLSVDPQQAQLTRAFFTWGGEAAALELAGSAGYAFVGDAPATLALEARQLDIDRVDLALRAAGGGAGSARASPDGAAPAGEPAPPPAARAALNRLRHHLSALTARIGDASVSGPAVDAQVDIGTLVCGGALVRDVSAAVRVRRDGIRVERAEALLPGETALEASGDVAPGPAGFSGQVVVRAAQPTVLARWWTGAPLARPVPPIRLAADVQAGAAGLDARRLSVRIGDTTANGRVMRARTPGEDAQLDVLLSAPLVDLVDVIAAGALAAHLGARPQPGANVRLDLEVDHLRMGSVDGSTLHLNASYRDGTLAIADFGAQNVAGARLFMKGAIGDLSGASESSLDGTVVLADGAALADGLSQIFAGSRAVRVLARRLPALAPGNIAFTLTGRAAGENAGLSLRATGTLGGTALTLDAEGAPFGAAFADRPVAVSLEARNDRTPPFLLQLGLPPAAAETPAQPAAADEGAALHLLAQGVPRAGLTSEAELRVGDATLRFEGRATLPPPSGSPAIAGRAALAIPRPGALASWLGHRLPPAAPVRVTADVEAQTGGLALTRLEGTVGTSGIGGRLEIEPDGVRGSVRAEEIDVAALVGLALGAQPLRPATGDEPAPAAGPFSAGPFAPPVLPPFPLRLALTTDRLAAGVHTLADTRFTLVTTPQSLALEGASARLADGRVSATLRLTRNGARASLDADVAAEDLALSRLLVREGRGAAIAGRLALSTRLTGSGYTAAGLVAALSGTGAITVTQGRLPGLDPDPLAALVARLDSAERLDEAALRGAVLDALAQGTLVFDRLAGTLDVAGGTVRLADVTLDGEPASGFGSAQLTLVTGALRAHGSLPLALPGEEAARLGLTLAGPLADLDRHIEVAPLAAWLSLRRLERQVEAVEQQNRELSAEADALDERLPAAPAAGAAPAAAPAAPLEPASGADNRSSSAPADPIGDLLRAAGENATPDEPAAADEPVEEPALR